MSLFYVYGIFSNPSPDHGGGSTLIHACATLELARERAPGVAALLLKPGERVVYEAADPELEAALEGPLDGRWVRYDADSKPVETFTVSAIDVERAPK